MLHVGALFSGWKIRNILFLLLLLTGIVPLAISGVLLVRQNSEIFETQEKSSLARSAMFLSIGLNDYLVEARRNLEQLGRLVITLSTHPDSQGLVTEETLREGYLGERTKQGRWLESYLESYLDEGPRWSGLRILDSSGSGPYSFPKELDETVIEALASTYRDAVVGEQSVWRLVGDSGAASGSSERTPLPFAVVTTPVSAVGFEGRVFVQGVLEIEPLRSGFGRGALSDVGVFLVDDSGGMLWYKGADARTAAAVETSQPIADFASPLAAFEQVLAHEQEVTARISSLYELALAEKDHALQSLLQWFIDEQVEEEDNARAAIDSLRLVGNTGSGLFIFDREMSQRTDAGAEPGGTA